MSVNPSSQIISEIKFERNYEKNMGAWKGLYGGQEIPVMKFQEVNDFLY